MGFHIYSTNMSSACDFFPLETQYKHDERAHRLWAWQTWVIPWVPPGTGELRIKCAPKGLCSPPAERKGTEVSCRPTWNLVNHEHGDAQLCSLQTDKAQLRQGSWGFQIRDLQNSSELWYPVKDCFHGILRFLQTSPRVGLLMTCQWNYTWGSFATETKGCESENSG